MGHELDILKTLLLLLYSLSLQLLLLIFFAWLRPMQTDATLLAKNTNNTQQCCDLLRPFARAFKRKR